MFVVCVPKKDAQREKEKLLSHSLLDFKRHIEHDDLYVYFPLLRKYKTPYVLTHRDLEARTVCKPLSLKDALKPLLTVKELSLVKTAFDLVGTLAILEIPSELELKEKLIAETLLRVNPHVKTVLKKVGMHSGEFRTQRLKVLAGKRTKEALYRENGIVLKVHLQNVYFSPRLSAERTRIASLIKKSESVLVMFSGVGPYCCVFGKRSPAKVIVGIEVNPQAHAYALENLKLNKLSNVTLYCGDVQKVVPQLKQKFDRIVMPLPRSAEDFLDVALSVSRKGTIIHLYTFCTKEDVHLIHKRIFEICSQRGFHPRILRSHPCGQYSPKKFRFCIDFSL